MSFDVQLKILGDYFSLGVDDYPWQIIELPGEAASLEDEARREISEAHPLFGVDLTALAECKMNHEVLFATDEKCYTIVRLTYQQESDGRYPKFTFFENFGGALEYIRTQFPFEDF